MPLPSLLTRLFHDGCYSVPTATSLRCTLLGKTPPSDPGLLHDRLEHALEQVLQSLGEPVTRRARLLQADVENALDVLRQASPDPRALRKLPSLDTVQQWLEQARFDPRLRPTLIADLIRKSGALIASLAAHGIPSSSRLHREAQGLATDIARGRGARPAPARVVRQLHEKLDAMEQGLLDFRCHRGALWEARAEAEQMNAGLRHLEELPPGVSVQAVRQLRGAHDRLKASLEQAAAQLAVGDLPAVRRTVAGMADLRLSLAREIATLDGAYAMRHRPRVTPASASRDSSPSPAPG